ncbi:hypothetical protein POVWA2_052330 [Plasmodium ovale wallikeri]|uniref:Uncharacterized protein n=1 Tax=Plasmodium ovale wallikeri TaxID=864142 RepID=A0A1A8ZQA0_PLAOA|nr:hypothetical protein POVWA1_053060 [Plasmodium ovale wallikeri]SBT46604.1 hypothetical protein POVWA2_052330 [Plasmodium ovale wallikeri]
MPQCVNQLNCDEVAGVLNPYVRETAPALDASNPSALRKLRHLCPVQFVELEKGTSLKKKKGIREMIAERLEVTALSHRKMVNVCVEIKHPSLHKNGENTYTPLEMNKISCLL